MPIRAPVKISEGQWIPEKTLAIEIKKLAIKKKVPAFLLKRKTIVLIAK